MIIKSTITDYMQIIIKLKTLKIILKIVLNIFIIFSITRYDTPNSFELVIDSKDFKEILYYNLAIDIV